MSDEISATDCNLSFEHHMRLYDGTVADCYLWPKDRKWSDLGALADFRFRIDDCGGMDFRAAHVADYEDYNTPASLKLK